MAENVKYYINGEERSSITLDESTEANSVDVQILNADDPAPTDFIFKQFVKVTSEDKWTDEVKNAVDENGSIAFLPFKDTGTGKNQIYAQGSYYGGGLDSSDVDQTKASFVDSTGKTMILTVDANGKLGFDTYKKITVSSSGGTTYEYDSHLDGGSVSLKATFSKEFTSSGWTGTGISNNTKSDLIYTATGSYQSNTKVTWNISGTEVQGDPSNSNTKATVSSSQSINWGGVSSFIFFADTNEILPSDISCSATGKTLTVTKGGATIIQPTVTNSVLGTNNVGLTGTYGKLSLTTNMYMYIIVRGNNATETYDYKINGSFLTVPINKVGTINVYSNNTVYTVYCPKNYPLDPLNNGTTISIS